MTHGKSAGKEIIQIHPDGHNAVVLARAKGKSFYEALGPDGLSLGVYNIADEAVSAAQWAWDFLQEDPAIRRLALMQLIIGKLALQYPLESAEVVLAPKG